MIKICDNQKIIKIYGHAFIVTPPALVQNTVAKSLFFSKKNIIQGYLWLFVPRMSGKPWSLPLLRLLGIPYWNRHTSSSSWSENQVLLHEREKPQNITTPGVIFGRWKWPPVGGVIFGRAPSAPRYFLLKTNGLYLVARNGPPWGCYIWGCYIWGVYFTPSFFPLLFEHAMYAIGSISKMCQIIAKKKVLNIMKLKKKIKKNQGLSALLFMLHISSKLNWLHLPNCHNHC